MITIRPAKIADCKECLEISKTLELSLPNGEPQHIEWLEAFVKENQIFLVAEEDKKIVGFAMGERVTGDLGLLHLIAVKKDSQDKGIGSKLLIEFENECKKRKLIVSFLYGYANNTKTIKFFEKNKYYKGSLMFEMGKYLGDKKWK